jgi:hypothetical protein
MSALALAQSNARKKISGLEKRIRAADSFEFSVISGSSV